MNPTILGVTNVGTKSKWLHNLGGGGGHVGKMGTSRGGRPLGYGRQLPPPPN